MHISDADKGAAAAYADALEFAATFICSQHRSETCGGKFGKGCKQLYMNFADATNAVDLRRARRSMPPAMRDYLDKVPDTVQCKLSHPGKLHGINKSNQGESENNAVMEVRECIDEFYALQRFIEYSQEKHVQHAAAASAALTYATPNVIMRLAEMQADADKMARFVWVHQATGKARVYPKTGTAHFDVCITEGADPTCTCGAPEVDRALCVHLALLRSKSRPARSLQSLVFAEDTVVRWRAQYAAAGEFKVPSVAGLGEPRSKPLLRPTAIPRGRGAPKKKRKGGRREAVLRYAKKFRREHGDEAEAVLAADAADAQASRAASRAATSAAAAAARRGPRVGPGPGGAASGAAPAATARRGARVGSRGGGRGRR